MPSLVVAATNVVPAPPGAPGAVAAPELHISKHKPSSMTIDNSGAIVDHNIEIWDSFTTDASHGAVAAFTTIRRHRVSALAGDVVILEKEDLAGVECLGNLSILADAIDAACLISIGWEDD